MDKIYLDKEFDILWEKIEQGENLALLRYGDGERAIMTGIQVTAQEGWTSPEGSSKFGHKLSETMHIKESNVYYGISCPCCDQSAYYWYLSRINNTNITFANIFVNANYVKFIEKFLKLNRDAIFIGNYRASNNPIGNLNVLKRYFIDDDCFKFYDKKYSSLIQQIKTDFGK